MRYARWLWGPLAFLLLALAPACRKSPHRNLQAKTQRVVRPPPQLVPLVAKQAIDRLPLDHAEPATVFVPIGARWPRPVIVAIHGKHDSPDANCEAWSVITEREYFVVCPALRGARQGSLDAAVIECLTTECLADEIREALVAVRKRFGRYVARNEVALAGFDDGAGRVVPIAMQNPTVFSVVWLANGGLKEWASALSSSYVERGGKLLGVICSDVSCEADTLRVAATANAAGLRTAMVKPGPFGISWDPRVTDAARLVWHSSKPMAWPWAIPVKSEHSTSQP